MHLGFAKDAYYCTIANNLLDSLGSRISKFFELSVAKRKNEFFRKCWRPVYKLNVAN